MVFVAYLNRMHRTFSLKKLCQAVVDRLEVEGGQRHDVTICGVSSALQMFPSSWNGCGYDEHNFAYMSIR